MLAKPAHNSMTKLDKRLREEDSSSSPADGNAKRRSQWAEVSKRAPVPKHLLRLFTTRRRPNTGKGDCLFFALVEARKRVRNLPKCEASDARALRAKLADAMLKNPMLTCFGHDVKTQLDLQYRGVSLETYVA